MSCRSGIDCGTDTQQFVEEPPQPTMLAAVAPVQRCRSGIT